MSDHRIMEALRLLAERPEILEAALAMATGESPLPTGSQPTIAQLWNEWLPWARQNMKSARLLTTHRNNLTRTKVTLPDGREVTLFELPWNQVTPEVADRYRAVRESTPSGRRGRQGEIGNVAGTTVNRELCALRSMLKYHRRLKKGPFFVPFEGCQMASDAAGARQTYLTPEQVKRFIEAGPPMWQDICTVAYRCAGMRHSEARLLRKTEIHWEMRVINLPASRNKNGRARVIPFPDDVGPILKHHCEASLGEYVFTDMRDPERKRPVGGAAMQYWLEQARERSGLVGFAGEPVVIHSLRHAGVTRLVTEGAPESLVKAAAGMCDVTFKRYLHFTTPQQDLLRAHMNASKSVAATTEGTTVDLPKGPR